AAFVDIGHERTAFLHASDLFNGNGPNTAPINERLREGQEIVVQVMKDPLGTKGARLTTQLTLPARYLVYMPHSKHIGISQKIGDDVERERLRNLVRAAMEEGDEGGYILRTLAETVDELEIQKDIRYLRRAWAACQERIDKATLGEPI